MACHWHQLYGPEEMQYGQIESKEISPLAYHCRLRMQQLQESERTKKVLASQNSIQTIYSSSQNASYAILARSLHLPG